MIIFCKVKRISSYLKESVCLLLYIITCRIFVNGHDNSASALARHLNRLNIGSLMELVSQNTPPRINHQGLGCCIAYCHNQSAMSWGWYWTDTCLYVELKLLFVDDVPILDRCICLFPVCRTFGACFAPPALRGFQPVLHGWKLGQFTSRSLRL